MLLFASPAIAQESGTEVPATRAEAIAEARADKVAELWPERQSPLVNRVNALLERGLKEGLDSGRGVNGPQIVLGGMRSGQGFTAGLGYRRSDLWRERLGYRATARGTFQGAYLFDFDLDFQGLRTERTSLRMVRERPLPFPPEPVAAMGINMTRWSLDRADHNRGRRNVLLKTLDALGLGFDS